MVMLFIYVSSSKTAHFTGGARMKKKVTSIIHVYISLNLFVPW